MAEDRTPVGQMNAALANEIVKIIAETTGRGSTRSRAFVNGDVVVCVLEDVLTRAERSLLEGGRTDLVMDQRKALQDLMRERLETCVERITGRTVRRFISGDSSDGEAAVEVFLLER